MTDCRLPTANCPKVDACDAEARASVVRAARSWLGTPYHHAADIKGAGVDCAMLLVRVYCDLGLVAPFDPRPYTKDWMLHRGEEKFLGFLLARSGEVATPQAGDVMLFRVGRCFAHGAIVVRSEPLTIIHAFAPAHCVVEDEIARNPSLADELGRVKYSSLWAVI